METEDQNHKQSEELLRIYQRRLYELEKKEAALGLDTPPQVNMEIADLKVKIAKIAAEQQQQLLRERYRQIIKLREQDRWQDVLEALADLEYQHPGYPDSMGLKRWAERRQRREKYYGAALLAYDRGEWTRALTALETLLKATPEDIEAQALLAKVRVKQRNAKFASIFLNEGKAILLFLSGSPQRWLMLGLLVTFLIFGLVWSRTRGETNHSTPTPTRQEPAGLTNVDKPITATSSNINAILKERIAFESKRDGDSEIYVIDASGAQTNLTKNSVGDYNPAWSPDGQRIAFISDRDHNGYDADSNPYTEVYIMNSDGSEPIRLTDTPVREGTPAWSRDGKYIAFLSYRDDGIHPEIYIMNADGTDQKRLTYDQSWNRSPTWSPDGYIAFVSYRAGKWGIYMMNADGSDQRLLKEAPSEEIETRYPAWSPDGKRIAFSLQQSSSDKAEIYVMNVDSGESVLLSNGSAFDQWPTWSSDGQYIAFMSNHNGNWDIYMMNVQDKQLFRLTTDPAFDANPAWSPSQN